MPLFVFDLIILAVLAFFAWRGAKKGLILSLCSLAGIFLAFFGARFLSQEFAPALSHIIEPGIYQTVLGAEPETDADRCIRCCACVKSCPRGARTFTTPFAPALARNFKRRKAPVYIY